MPNYNDNNTRDNSIDQLPRMIFQLPNTESGTALPSVNPVFFCQSGCAIDYHFSNIKSCQFNNDGKKFTITPTDSANINYIMWNGTDMNSGEKMVQYTLKEVYFTAPAKDYLGANNDFLSQSIQYYFVFVNEKYSNLMICISVIGSVNNLGNAPKSNGFVMMETLSTRIPTVNVQSNLGNLNNFNLGTLIPPNKPFFSTLITNNIQYIIITEVVDIPVEFFSNMTTMVNGGTQLYNAKMNQFRTNIPQNPPTTILFYNENSQLLDSQSQNLVCNSNCDLVPSKKVTPSIGTYTSSESEKKKEEKRKTISGSELAPEKCEEKDVWVNQQTKPKPIKNPSKPDGSNPNLDDKDPTHVIALTVSIMIVLVVGTIVVFLNKTNKNTISIIILVISLVCLIVGLSVGCGIYTQQPQNYWIAYIFGALVWLISIPLLMKFKNSDSYSYGTNYSSYNSTTSSINKQKPYSGITVPTGFNQPQKSWFGKMFSSSNSHSKPIDYSPQITVPSSQNTPPKQSFFDRMFKKSSNTSPITIPSTTVPSQVSSPLTVPQSSSTTMPPQQTQSFFSKINPFSKQEIQLTPNIIKSKTKLIEDIQGSSLSQTNKNKLMSKLNNSRSSNIVKRLNDAYKELNRLKSK